MMSSKNSQSPGWEHQISADFIDLAGHFYTSDKMRDFHVISMWDTEYNIFSPQDI